MITIIFGKPGVGKTALMTSFAVNNLFNGKAHWKQCLNKINMLNIGGFKLKAPIQKHMVFADYCIRTRKYRNYDIEKKEMPVPKRKHSKARRDKRRSNVWKIDEHQFKNAVELNKRKGWNYKLATCGEKGRYPGVEPNHCVDDELIIRRAYHDKELMAFLKASIKPMPKQDLFGESEPLPADAIILGNGQYATRGDNTDKGQRQFCGCTVSKDIGEYNTCPHLCEYCYANASKSAALKNWERHKTNELGETITGEQ